MRGSDSLGSSSAASARFYSSLPLDGTRLYSSHASSGDGRLVCEVGKAAPDGVTQIKERPTPLRPDAWSSARQVPPRGPRNSSRQDGQVSPAVQRYPALRF